MLGGNKSEVAVFAVQVPSLASLQAGDVNPCADATAGKPAAAAWGFPLLVGSCNAAANNITGPLRCWVRVSAGVSGVMTRPRICPVCRW